jgi:molybdenum cofactor synthesis domain-containing protein
MNKTRPFKELKPFDEAFDLIMKRITPVTETEKIPIEKSLNRILAEDVSAPLDVAPFNRAAMDGYAVKAKDTYNATDLSPITLKSIGAVYAGDSTDMTLNEGQCVKIATGAMLPDGADSVVMVEYTQEKGNDVLIHRPVHPGENSSKKGSDIPKGSQPLNSGIELYGARIGVSAALGLTELPVFIKPRVVIAATGNEICPLGQELRPGQVYDINTYTLASVVEDAGGEPVYLDLVDDTREALEGALDKALKMGEIIVFSGGSSVGERDLLVDVFGSRGEILFHGVQLKPGKPVLAAICRERLCLGLPGYPTSCLTSALLFLAPAIRKLAHRAQLWAKTVKAILGRRVPSTLGRTQVLTVRLEANQAVPAFKESGAITSMAQADGYIIIPSNVDLLEKGEDVEVFLL